VACLCIQREPGKHVSLLCALLRGRQREASRLFVSVQRPSPPHAGTHARERHAFLYQAPNERVTAPFCFLRRCVSDDSGRPSAPLHPLARRWRG
jgi:hypothetical protein